MPDRRLAPFAELDTDHVDSHRSLIEPVLSPDRRRHLPKLLLLAPAHVALGPRRLFAGHGPGLDLNDHERTPIRIQAHNICFANPYVHIATDDCEPVSAEPSGGGPLAALTDITSPLYPTHKPHAQRSGPKTLVSATSSNLSTNSENRSGPRLARSRSRLM